MLETDPSPDVSAQSDSKADLQIQTSKSPNLQKKGVKFVNDKQNKNIAQKGQLLEYQTPSIAQLK